MQRILNKNYITPLIHIALWGLVFFWPFIMVQEKVNINRVIVRNWLPSFSLLVIFYVNYWWLVDAFFFEKKKRWFLACNVFLLLAFLVFLEQTISLFHNDFPEKVAMFKKKRGIMISSIQMLVPMILTIGMCVGVKLSDQWKKKELILEKIKKSQLDSEIKYLRHQIQPHFLFNTLNNIYSLVDSAPGMAKTSIHSLSKMMRYLLHDSNDNRVSLTKEIEFLERFIDLMKLRVANHLTLETNFPIINQPIQIAPLLLLSFVENAFKHGINATQPSFIKINLTIEENKIHYTVENSSFPEKNSATDSGVGLSNLRKRLSLLYTDKYELFEGEKNNVYTAKLTINFKE